jgi:vacuolar iron transporter family protein
MPSLIHAEQHFSSSETVRDIVLGMADGLTVPFALAAGLSGAALGAGVVVAAGLAEIAAGSLAMGLGGYLAGKTDREHYASERAREERETREHQDTERREVAQVFAGFGLTDEQAAPVVETICADGKRWVDFMMRFELDLTEPDPARARKSAWTIAVSYVVGGLIPLAPYMAIGHLGTALLISVAFTLAALFGFGYVKGKLTGITPLRGGAQTMLIGGLAAGAAFLIARLVGG